jgi:cytoskeletal protein CcmA (bactofilin family)
MSDATKKETGVKTTLVHEGTEIKGNVASTCPILVMGRIEGEISGPSMDVAESGKVSGRIKVTELCCRGEIAGQFEAESVKLSGRVHDQTLIRAQSLEVLSSDGGAHAVLFGECELSIGEEPEKQRAIDEATGVAVPAAPIVATALAAPEAVNAAASPPEASAPHDPDATERRRKRNTGAVRIIAEPPAQKSPT